VSQTYIEDTLWGVFSGRVKQQLELAVGFAGFCLVSICSCLDFWRCCQWIERLRAGGDEVVGRRVVLVTADFGVSGKCSNERYAARTDRSMRAEIAAARSAQRMQDVIKSCKI
jgi:hypothetical protein